jgi:hypothetical protein
MLEKQQKNKKKTKKCMGKIRVIKKRYILGNLFVVIISPFTNHFTAGVIEFQAEITVYCDTCTRETIH